MRVSRYWRLKEQTYRLQQKNGTLLSRPEKVVQIEASNTDVAISVDEKTDNHKTTQAA